MLISILTHYWQYSKPETNTHVMTYHHLIIQTTKHKPSRMLTHTIPSPFSEKSIRVTYTHIYNFHLAKSADRVQTLKSNTNAHWTHDKKQSERLEINISVYWTYGRNVKNKCKYMFIQYFYFIWSLVIFIIRSLVLFIHQC